MEIHTNIPLKNYTTMRLGGNARFMTEVHTPQDVVEVCSNALNQHIPIFVLGGGSNTIVRDEGYPGIVIRNRIPGFEVIAEDAASLTIKVGAGESWDTTVQRTVDLRLSGIEALSAIPGTTGAAPVQNIGAYGQEISETLQSVEAYDNSTGSFVTLQNEDCGFSYRHSIFRGNQAGRYIITYVTLKLFKTILQPPFYAALQAYFDSHQTPFYTPDVIRNAVIDIRREKLPDPSKMPNSGSFFKNAMIESWQVDDLKASYPDAAVYDMGNGTYKVPTGWLIEEAGFKGELLHGMRVHDKNTLVLINESASTYQDLAAARDEIAQKVQDQFRIHIEQEPLEL